MKVGTIQTSFIGGAIDETARARVDTGLYKAAAAELVNCLPLATGGQLSRWGSRHCATLASATVTLAEFSFSLAQSYVAAFTAERVDFFFASDGATAGVLTEAPWTAAQVPTLRFAQAGDVMWVVHPDMVPQVIRRTGASSWVMAAQAYDSVPGTPYYRYVDQAVTAAWNATLGEVTFTAAFLSAGYVGTVLKMWDEGALLWRLGTITALISASVATVTWTGGAPSVATPTRLWFEQAFSSVRGWPRSVALHQQRLWIGGGRDAGDAVFASRIALYWDFDLLNASDAAGIAITLASDAVRTISQTLSGPQLTFMTESAPFYVVQNRGAAITPLSTRIVKANSIGSSAVRAGAFDEGVLYVQARGRAVRDMIYSADQENLASEPVSLAATDTLGTVVDAAYASSQLDRPEQYAFFVNTAGRLAVFHSLRSQQIAAWVEWRTAGAYVAIVYAGTALFAAVTRAGTTRLERFDPSLAFDAGLPGVSEPFVAAHLASQVIHGRNGDDYFGSGTANVSGAVTVQRRISDPAGPPLTGEIGLAFDWWIVPLPPVVDLPSGTSVQKVKRVVAVHLRLLRARSARVGADAMTLLADGFAVGAAPPPRTGWWRSRQLGVAQTEDAPAAVRRIDRDVPMPCGVLAMKREVSF